MPSTLTLPKARISKLAPAYREAVANLKTKLADMRGKNNKTTWKLHNNTSLHNITLLIIIIKVARLFTWGLVGKKINLFFQGDNHRRRSVLALDTNNSRATRRHIIDDGRNNNKI